MSQAANQDAMLYEGESQQSGLHAPYRSNNIFSTTKKRARGTQFDHVPEEDSDYI